MVNGNSGLKKLNKLLVLLTTMFVFVSLASAQAQRLNQASVGKIDVRGNQRIETETITSLLDIEPGQTLTAAKTDEALKKLFNIGYFADAKIYREGSTLVVQVEENPVVNQLALEGNDKISDEIIKGELSLKPRQVYTQTRLKNDAQRIQDIYRLKGHFAAVVTPKIIKRDQNRIDIIFEIDEGEPTVVRKIFFVGNKHYSDTKLETVVQTKETRWYRFFTNDDNYDPDRLAYDRELLRKFYLEHGYADFLIKSAVAELSPDRKEFFITFTINEGERYHFGKVKVTSALPKINTTDLDKLLTFKEGDWYSSKDVEKTITKMTDALGAKGFAFVEIKPILNKNKETMTVDIEFKIQEGPKVYIDKIVVIGNERTNEEVIRRELFFYEGDPYNTNSIKMSERRLKGLGFFKKVNMKIEASNAPDKVNIVIEVEEERTAEISLGGGYSTSDGPIGDIKFADTNVGGKGNELEIGARISKRSQEYNLFFGKPHFLDRDLHAGFRLFNIIQKKDYDEAFDQKSLGSTVSLGYFLTENITQSVYYTISQEQISNLNQNASKYIREIQGKALLSAVGQAISYDRRDSRHNPTEGYVLTLSNEYAGIGGKINYLKNKISGTYIYSISDDVIMYLNGAVGNIMRVGRKLRVSDRMTLGGDFRGFDVGGITPRDAKTLEPLGGTKYYTATTEVNFPIGLPNEFNVKGAAFVDAGSVYDSGLPAADVYDNKKLRAAGGFGMRWASPMGPISVDFAKPFLSDKHDKQRILNIQFKTRF